VTQFDGSKCYEHIRKMSVEIGPRVSGTAGEQATMEYIKAQFESFGLKTWVGEFDVDNDRMVTAKLEITEPALGIISSNPFLGCQDTSPEGLETEVVWVENINEPEIGPHIEGKIVVVQMGLNLLVSMPKLLKYKPAAAISYSATLANNPNTFHIVVKNANAPAPDLPVMFVTYLDAVKLYNAGTRRARITIQTERKPGKSYYVIGEKAGSLLPDEIVVIGGHMDSVPLLQGATDNAAGTATVLELARVFSQRETKRTLRFAAWGSEEGGLLGSKKYVFELKAKAKIEKKAEGFIEGFSKTELDKHIFNINLDVLGMSLGYDNVMYMGDDSLGAYVDAVAKELGIPHKVNKSTYSSDGMSFSWEDIPSISFARGGVGDQVMHTVGDSIDLISPKQLEKIGALVEVFMQRTVTDGYIFPFPREVPKDLIKKDVFAMKRIKDTAKFLGYELDDLKD
jgi:aminopeptidase YwaD